MDLQEKQQFLEYWEKKRQSGWLVYVLRSGFIYSLLIMVVNLSVHWYNQGISEALSKILLSWRLLFFLGSGLAIGALLWFVNERTYRKVKKNTGR